MSDYSVTIDGIEELVSRINKAGNGDYLKSGLEAMGVDLVGKAQKYPPVPQGSKYQRTNKLRNSWTYQVSNDNEVLRLGNNVEYAPYVMGRGEQSRVHELHGWKTIQDIVEENLERLTNTLKRYLERVLNG